MTPLRAWSLISVNFLIYCVPGLSLSCTNLNLEYPETFSVSDSPVEPCTYPTWRFRQETGGEMQISPLPCSCMGNGSKGPKGLCSPCWQPAHTEGHTQHLLSSKDLRQWTARLKVFAGGEHPSPKLSAELHRTGPGYRGWEMSDTAFAVFGLQRNRRGKKEKSSLRNTYCVRASQAVLPSAGVVSPVWQMGTRAQSGWYQLLKAKAGDWGKDKTSEILILNQDTIFSFLLSMLIFAFLTAFLQHRSPLSPSSSSGKGGTNFQLKHNAVRDILGSISVFPLIFVFIWSSQNLLRSN